MRMTSYASGTAASSAESPSAAAIACNANPVDVPASETKPAARPCASVRETRNSMFGPGVAASAMHATQNSNHVVVEITAISSRALDRERRRLAAADAKRRNAALATVLAQGAKQRHDDPRARRADRMAERAGAPVNVDPVARDAVLLHRRHR